MSNLESTKADLLRTEQLQARLKGEKAAVEAQLTQAREKLVGLGVAEEEIPGHLDKLSAEAVELKAKIVEIEAELTAKMGT